MHGAIVNQTEHGLEVVTYLSSKYPELIHSRDAGGRNPLHWAMLFDDRNLDMMQIMCTSDPLVARDVSNDSRTPLHLLVQRGKFTDPLHKDGACLRYLLNIYPEAAGLGMGQGEAQAQGATPYTLAVERGAEVHPHYLRLLLNAAPDQNPAEMRRVNYAERRVGMFLFYSAVFSGADPTIFARLRIGHPALVKKVMSFL